MYITEKFETKEQRNERYRQLLVQGKADVVKYSDAVRASIEDKWHTEWYVAYPPVVIETVEQYVQEVVVPEAVNHDQEMA